MAGLATRERISNIGSARVPDPSPTPIPARHNFRRLGLDSLRTGAGRIALWDLGVNCHFSEPRRVWFFESDFSEGQGHLHSAGKVEPSAASPTVDPGLRSARRTQGVLCWVEERRRCSSSRSFLTRLDKWTRCGISVFYSQELQNPQAWKQ